MSSPPLIAGFSTREGGFSQGHQSSLNLSYSVNDDRAAVEQNRRSFFATYGVQVHELATAGQVHGTRTVEVTAPGFTPECDGLVTSKRDLFLCITAADCAAVLLADTENGVVGACHAGWRGAVGRIVSKTIQAMHELGAVRDQIQAFVGPCISLDHFEVGEEVARQFPETVIDRTRNKPHVDLKIFLQMELVAAGLEESKIEISKACTFRDSQRFFSHRAHKGRTGRMMAFIGLR